IVSCASRSYLETWADHCAVSTEDADVPLIRCDGVSNLNGVSPDWSTRKLSVDVDPRCSGLGHSIQIHIYFVAGHKIACIPRGILSYLIASVAVRIANLAEAHAQAAHGGITNRGRGRVNEV